jgi:HEAT repeat protein
VVSLSQIEDQYRAATSLKEKIKTIRLLVNVRDEGTAVALGRMFHAEKDPELREEILETLIDIKGSEADKLSVLASAVASSQPAEIREVAIDIMIDLGSRNAIPVLQNLVNDPDTKIRDAAKDAIRQIQNPIPPSTSKMDENDVDEE